MGTASKTKADPFRALYEANHQRVCGHLRRMVGPQDAEDLAQTVFAKGATALPTFRGEAEASTWLYRIAVNVASDWLRSRSTHEANVTVPLLDVLDEDRRVVLTGSAAVAALPSPEQELAHKDIHDCIRGEIGKLLDAHRNLFITQRSRRAE